jgi:hypothetical protein
VGDKERRKGEREGGKMFPVLEVFMLYAIMKGLRWDEKDSFD